MPRPPRVQFAGAVCHVTARGNRRAVIFHDDDDYGLFDRLLGRTLDEFGWRSHVHCLMPNHFHLVVELLEANLSAGMHWLKSRYAQLYHERYETSGHVFQGRFWSEIVETDEHYEELCPYVYENPDRAGLCTPAKPWVWRGGLLAPRDMTGVRPWTGPS